MRAPNDLILVTGGTGHLGRHLVSRLLEQGRDVRILARKPGADPRVQWARGDLATGNGLPEACGGARTVIHAATFSPIARRGGRMMPVDFFRSPPEVDVAGTRRLLEAAKAAGVAHFIHASIVGLDDARLPYSKVKLAGEKLVRESSVPWSVVRATPFFYLLHGMLEGMRWLPVWPLPEAPMQPVDTTDVAAYLAECVDDGKRGMREEIGGPDLLPCAELARAYQSARGIRRPIWRLPVSGRTARSLGLCPAIGRRGRITWAAWLASRPQTRGSGECQLSRHR